MNKNKLKSLAKTAKKTAREDIKLSLITGLKEVASKFVKDSKKLNKEIVKVSNELAQKFSKKLKTNKLPIDHNEVKTAQVVETTKPESTTKSRINRSLKAKAVTEKPLAMVTDAASL